MPKYLLQMKAEVINISEIYPCPGRDWNMKLQCSKCKEETENYINVDETVEMDTGTGGLAGSVYKCKFCRATTTITIDNSVISSKHHSNAYGYFSTEFSTTNKTLGYKDNSIVAFEIRGSVPISIELDNKWCAIGLNSNTIFNEVDLTDYWADYDGNEQQEVTIEDVHFFFTAK